MQAESFRRTQKLNTQNLKITAHSLRMRFGRIENRCSGDVILAVLARQRQPAAPPSITTPDALRLKIEPAADCGRYDSIRKVA